MIDKHKVETKKKNLELLLTSLNDTKKNLKQRIEKVETAILITKGKLLAFTEIINEVAEEENNEKKKIKDKGSKKDK